MKSLFAAAAILAFGACSASAADLAPRSYTKASPPIVAHVYNWTGFYIGAEAGRGWGGDRWGDVYGTILLANPKPDGALAGGVVGFNWQFTPHLVVGIEGSFNWANLNDRQVDVLAPEYTVSTKIDRLFTATGRLGYAWGSWMVYGKGGAAWTRDENSFIAPAFGNFFFPAFNREGWTAGGGIEWMFANSWSAKVEYDHYDFGQKDTFLGEDEHLGARLNLDSVKAGINYHFN